MPQMSTYTETCLLTLAAWILWNNANYFCTSRSQWARGLRCWSAATRLLRLWVRIHWGMDVCLLWVLCFVRYRSLRWADHSSRGVLPTVVCRRAWSRNLVNEKALAHWKAVAPETNKQNFCIRFLNFGVRHPKEGINDIKTCSSDIRLYIYVSNVHSLVSWMNTYDHKKIMKEGNFCL